MGQPKLSTYSSQPCHAADLTHHQPDQDQTPENSQIGQHFPVGDARRHPLIDRETASQHENSKQDGGKQQQPHRPLPVQSLGQLPPHESAVGQGRHEIAQV